MRQIFNEPSFRIMLREKPGLDIHQLGRIGLKRLRNQGMQSLAGAAK